MKRWQLLAPAAALAAAGCVASKADIMLLQDEIRTLRAMQARADTARKAQLDSSLRVSARTNDSLRALAQRFGAFQANMSGELFEMGRQLIRIQEIAGVSASSISGLRKSLEDREQQAATMPDSTPQQPGPAQLFQLSFDQLRNRSYATARAGFDELLRLYPDFVEASKAQLYVAQSYADEKRIAEADSVYTIVWTKYPRSPDAATALYKFGLSQLSQNKTTAGRAALQRVIREFPSSTEAELARSRLGTGR
jgi:tol-pal system protein YbgF